MNNIVTISILIMSSFLFGQDDLYDHGLDQNKWEDIRDGIRYEGREGPGREWTYENKDEYDRERKKYESENGTGSGGMGTGGGDGASKRAEQREYRQSPQPSATSKSGQRFNGSSLGGLGFFEYLIIGVFFAGLIFLIFYLFVNVQSKGEKITGEPINFEEVNPTEIPLTELQRLLQDAIAEKNYRGAVRIYFIFIVRDLASKNWIKWEKEKTNFQYLREMTGKNEFDDFNTSVNYFEIIWYGKREIDAEKFEKVAPSFTKFLDKLGVK